MKINTKNKKFICVLLSLCLVLGSFSFIFADQVTVLNFLDATNGTYYNAGTWSEAVKNSLSSIGSRINTTNSRLNTIINALTDNSNSYILTNMLTQIRKLTHISDQLDLFLGSDGTTTITQNWSEFTSDMYKLVRFLAPISNSAPGVGNSFMTLWDYVFYEASQIHSLWGGWDTEFSNLTGIHSDTTYENSLTEKLVNGLTNKYISSINWDPATIRSNANQYLLVGENQDNIERQSYYITESSNNGVINSVRYLWSRGSPLGNIAFILNKLNDNLMHNYNWHWIAALTDYTGNLGIWNSEDHTQTSWSPTSAINGLYNYLAYLQKDMADWDYYGKLGLTNYFINRSDGDSWTYRERAYNASNYLITGTGTYSMYQYDANGVRSENTLTRYWSHGSPIGHVAELLKNQIDNTNLLLTYNVGYYDEAQTPFSWLTANNAAAFTARSSTEGLYNWLKNIQIPLARLSFVHASDGDIQAKKDSEPLETAIETNFINPSGSGAASASDIGNVSDLSFGFKNNISTDASVSGIWNIFNTNNFGWFSQETANQLDTTGSSTKMLKNNETYPTPLLDQQIGDIMKILGGSDND